MFIVLLILAVMGVIALCFFLLVELNEIEKSISSLVEKITNHYEPR
jgi:hypothetical protein